MRWQDRCWVVVGRGADVFGFWGVAGVGSMIAGVLTFFGAASDNAPKLTSIGWLFVFLGATAGVLVVIALAGIALRSWRSGPATKALSDTALEVVANQTFSGQTVIIDGKRFIGCMFSNCTVQFGGGPCRFDDIKCSGKNTLIFTNPASVDAMCVADIFGLLKDGSMISSPVVRRSITDKPSGSGAPA